MKIRKKKNIRKIFANKFIFKRMQKKENLKLAKNLPYKIFLKINILFYLILAYRSY